MITIASFGEQYGRLGNQIFQVAMLFAVQHCRGFDFWLPRDGEELWECFDLEVAPAGPPPRHEYFEPWGSCNFDGRVFEQPDGTAYHGYFQSYRYLEHCKDDLVRFLRFNARHVDARSALLAAYRRRHGAPLVSLHVRRGDYVAPDSEDRWGNLAKDGYYQRAVEAIGKNALYLVFSDDIAWCRDNLGVQAVYVEVDQYTALCLMTGCDINVVANSTFSWWGAYLNPNADVYAPSRWFRDASPPYERQDDIVPPTWRTLPTFA